ncbi:hypothetical protein ACOSQ3_024969 [Xanthoceras sorbifolium]
MEYNNYSCFLVCYFSPNPTINQLYRNRTGLSLSRCLKCSCDVVTHCSCTNSLSLYINILMTLLCCIVSLWMQSKPQTTESFFMRLLSVHDNCVFVLKKFVGVEKPMKKWK